MNDTITLADPAVSCDAAKNIAARIDALALVFAAALESPRRHEAIHAAAELLTLIRMDAHRVRRHIDDAAEAIGRAVL